MNKYSPVEFRHYYPRGLQSLYNPRPPATFVPHISDWVGSSSVKTDFIINFMRPRASTTYGLGTPHTTCWYQLNALHAASRCVT